ncbi:bifunctional lysylphosphatidylglycerol flippase/synthetase MprF [Neobacillus sp. PS3-40]|uniref:bifunctional lysylphosphatidylglycerol flippase/synthetase MprF n=1 Tax=Neobacillus sp. PS3-40 TaxID=3070679 RepID=UPI0027E0A198|nr:bifunctional lysylphosphatidylglycerol flippase/synthetase MprF [Neobacillus sp. PS3-40]WML44937.1 bifunctional lysylphosphatidylglycerol flippase/synthetase MprF [Neobacillus sp. PS3-40]
MLRLKKEKVFTTVKFTFPLLLLILAIFEMKKFAGSVNVHLLRQEVNRLQFGSLILILCITIVAIFPMFFYDAILVRILGFHVSKKELIENSFIANSFSNLIGFGGLVGAMLRTYFYHNYEHDKKRLLGGIASVSLFYLTGISLFAWIVTIGYRHFALFSDVKWLYLAVLAVGFYLPAFVFIHILKHKKEDQTLITFEVGIKLVLVSILEWTAIFVAVWLLSLILGLSIGVNNLLPVFIIASCAGIISMIPGGLGSFDLVFIWGMQDLHASSEKVLVLLLFYRIGYFVIPFLIGLVLFIKSYWEKWNKSWNNLPNEIVQGLSHIILTILVFLSGIILLLSASVPGIMSRMRLAQELLSFPIMNISHQISVALGFLLLGLSRGIEYNVKRAYELTMFALILAALFSIFKGIDYEEAIFLIIVAFLFRIAKSHFYRESYVMTWGKTLFDVTLILIITSMYLIIGYSNLPSAKINLPNKLLPYVILDYRDLFNSALFGLFIAFLILIFGYLISKPKKWIMQKSIGQEQEILDHLKKYHGKALSHLIFLHDKNIFWNRKRNVLLSFQPYADKLVVLGDPIGEKSDIADAIQEFQEISDLYGYTPVFYQVSNDMLQFLHGNGYVFFKLGEDAFVDLTSFHHSDKKIKGLKIISNKYERENYQFEIVHPEHSSELLETLRKISDDWLEGRNEKGFSLGFFNELYLNKAEIALVKNQKEQIIGFASIMPIYDQNFTISVDLMRISPDSPTGTIDFLFLSMFEWANKNGYKRFNMGMAPLTNVGLSRFSFLSERIAAQIFLHGHFIYHFQGLRNFKERFTDIWEPKYLAYRRKSSLPFTMLQITLLISKKRM